MKRLAPAAGILLVALAAAALVSGALGTFRPGAAPERGWTPAQLESELICPVCNGPLVQFHTAPADQIRASLERYHEQGATRSAVRARLVKDYGRRVLADTPTSGGGLIAWLAPIAILLAGLVLAVGLARRWQAPPPGGDVAPTDERYELLLDDHLRTME